MIDWVPLAFQVVSMALTIIGVIVGVSTRMARIEGRIDSLAIEIRKDRELYEHRIRQLEIGIGQVRNELTRLSYQVGGLKSAPEHERQP